MNTRGYSDFRYEPTPAEVFSEMLAAIAFDPREFVFVDLGSGKGKVLMLAARYPFQKVIGVELWEDLHRIALENLDSFRRRPECAAEVFSIRMDAAEFPLPDEPLVLYFFNPFPEAVLTRVVANLRESLARVPRTVYVLFYGPVRRGAPWDRRKAFEASGYLRVFRDDPRFTLYTAS